MFKQATDYETSDEMALNTVGQTAKKGIEDLLNSLYSKKDDLLQEKSLIGFLLLKSNFVNEVQSILQKEEVFLDDVNKELYHSIYTKVNALKKDESNDNDIVLQLNDILKEFKNNIDSNTLNDFNNYGAENYLKNCIELVGEFDKDKAITNAKIVRSNYDKRVTVDALTEALVQAQQDKNSELMLAKVNARINELESQINSGLQRPSIMVEKYLNQLRDTFFGLVKENVRSTGYTDLDKLIDGVKGGQLIIVGGRPAMGKTMFVLNLVNNIIQEDKNSCIAYFSLEMGYKELYDRLLSNRLRMSSNQIKHKDKIDNDQFKAINRELSQIKKEKLFISDEEGTILSNIESGLDKLYSEQKRLDLVVVDYLQLIESADGESNNGNRERLIATVSRSLKKIAKKYDVPVVALTQLNRDLEKRQDKRPTLSDIRESGAIEQDADIVMFLYRDDYYTNEEKSSKKKKELPNPFDEDVVVDSGDDDIVFEEENDDNTENDNPFETIISDKNEQANELMNDNIETSVVEVIVAKNREGATGKADLLMIKNYNSFVNLSHKEEDDANA